MAKQNEKKRGSIYLNVTRSVAALPETAATLSLINACATHAVWHHTLALFLLTLFFFFFVFILFLYSLFQTGLYIKQNRTQTNTGEKNTEGRRSTTLYYIFLFYVCIACNKNRKKKHWPDRWLKKRGGIKESV